jgi:ribonuclease P protein component
VFSNTVSHHTDYCTDRSSEKTAEKALHWSPLRTKEAVKRRRMKRKVRKMTKRIQ